MKTLIILPLLAFLLGCGTVTPKKATYTTLGTVGIAADNAMKTASAARASGKINDADWQSISVKRDMFNAAYTAACKSAAFNTNQTASANLALIKDDLVNLVDQITKAKK